MTEEPVSGKTSEVDTAGGIARRAGSTFAALLRPAAQAIGSALGFAVQVVLALVLLFEEWGWRPLSAALAWLGEFKIVARLERVIAGLPPYAALAALALPTSVLFPLKLLALYLVAQGKVVAAGFLFVGAKIASTALIARLFMLTRPALMQLSWFAALYNVVMPWKEALFEKIRASWAWRYGRMLKNRVRLEVKQAWIRLKPAAERAREALLRLVR
jgi:hypothetical protein